jgi:DNA polymerase gamma 1
VECKGRRNAIDVQQLSDYIYPQIFGNRETPVPDHLVKLAQEHLSHHDLLGKVTDTTPPIGFDVPALQGQTLDEHFYRLGVECGEPYLTSAKLLASKTLQDFPRAWVRQSGWTRYPKAGGGKPVKVAAPEEDILCFDVEVLYKESPYAIMACAASPDAWYAWLSPWLLGESKTDKHLVPLGDPSKDRVIVGHNIGYDRARILEEYDLKQTRNAFLDTMSLHVAVNGMCSQQRPTWMKARKNREMRERIATNTGEDVALAELLRSTPDLEEEEELWVGRSSINSLRDVAQFHLNVAVDKSIRDEFGQLDRAGVLERLDTLLTYCAADVDVTHRVFRAIFPTYLEFCPHPVSFAALRHLSSVILPVNRSWDAYIANAEATYQKLSDGVQERLEKLARQAVVLKDDDKEWENDNWLKQLDWSGQEIRMTKGTKKVPSRPVARQKMPGMPKWFKELFATTDGPMKLTVRTRVAALLLKLSWDGFPLFWSDTYGWTFRVPIEEAKPYLDGTVIKCDKNEETIVGIKWDTDHYYFKLPHKDGPTARCTNPLAKSYLMYFENGRLSSQYLLAKEALEMNASCSYWISARDRIMSQMVVYDGELGENKAGVEAGVEAGAEGEQAKAEDVEATAGVQGDMMVKATKSTEAAKTAEAPVVVDAAKSTPVAAEAAEATSHAIEATAAAAGATDGTADIPEPPAESPPQPVDPSEVGYILPQLIPMGTITRRAVERTWLTASNAKKNRVGSELKAMVKAPKGYSFVGADVDSEELWIASLMGDATFKLHGGNAIGFMTLEGTKAAGTDLHSRTASILGITRNDAKVFNYGRIYGAGLKFAATLLRQFNPSLSEAQTTEVAGNLYKATKGDKGSKKALHPRPFWRGGTESFVFNRLEEFAEQDRARTPVLGAAITEALMARYVSKGGYLTSRINWAIQSSGVDYLHLLIVGMDYLIRRFNIGARLAITVHDEIRYLVRNEDRYRAAMALQVANLWTRAMFAEQVGMTDLPQSCAFFSAVDVDHVLRKEVDMPCITPSHTTPIPPGESLDIQALLAKGDEARLDSPEAMKTPHPHAPPAALVDEIPYTRRTPVMEELEGASAGPSPLFIRAQMARSEKELRDILAQDKVAKKAAAKTTPPTTTTEADTPQKSPRTSTSLFPSVSKKRERINYTSEPNLPQYREPVMVSAALRTGPRYGYQGAAGGGSKYGGSPAVFTMRRKNNGFTASGPGGAGGASSGWKP